MTTTEAWSNAGLTGKGLLQQPTGCKQCGNQAKPYCWECGACPNCAELIDLYSTGKPYDRHICRPCSQTRVGKIIMTYPDDLRGEE